MTASSAARAAFRHPRGRQSVASARPRIIAIVIAAVLLIAGIWAIAVQTTRDQRARSIDDAIRENGNRVSAFAQFITSTLDEADSATRFVATRQARRPVARPLSPAAPRILPDMLKASSLFVGIDITNADGMVVLSGQDTAGRADMRATPAFRAFSTAPTRQAPFIGDPAPLYGRGPVAIPFSRPIVLADGSFAGIVTFYIPIKRLTDFFHGADFRQHDLMSVIRLDGLTLARREGPVVSHGQMLAGTRVMQEQYANPNGTYIGPSALDGIERIFSHRRLPAYGLFVTTGVGFQDVLSLSWSRSRVFYGVIAALSLAILLCAALLCIGLVRGERRMRRLAATNERLREAQRIGRIGDWELDLASGMLVCSDQLCRMHDRDPARDVVSTREALAFHSADAQGLIRRTLHRAIETREAQVCEVVSPISGGRIANLRIRIAPVIDPDGRIRTVLGTEQDVSAEKQHEELRAEVAHMARVEAVNLMAATIAHELSQPLTAASNFLAAASHVSVTGEGTRTDRDNLAKLLTQAKRQIGLASTIIGRARDMMSDSRHSEVASLDEIVDDAITLSRAANPAAQHVSLSASILPDTGHVAADKVQIQQVLLNLIRNAMEAVSDRQDGRVVVSSRRAEGGMVMVCVSDNGPGLPAESNIFQPFGSSKEGGLGIGLSICRTIIDSYGGRIWNEPSPLGGAAICFTLPLDELAMLFEIA